MSEDETPVGGRRVPPEKRPIHEVQRKLRGMGGTLVFLVLLQLVTMAGVGALLWHTFLRTG